MNVNFGPYFLLSPPTPRTENVCLSFLFAFHILEIFDTLGQPSFLPWYLSQQGIAA